MPEYLARRIELEKEGESTCMRAFLTDGRLLSLLIDDATVPIFKDAIAHAIEGDGWPIRFSIERHETLPDVGEE